MSAAKYAEEPSTHPKELITQGRRNVPMVQNVLLIWLDQKTNDDTDDTRNTISQLKQTVNEIKTFIDPDPCIQFLETINDEKACMIISGTLGESIVPRIHNMSQIDSIFIFCGSKKRHEGWAGKYGKVRDVFTEITLICEALKKASRHCEQNAIPMSFVSTNGDVSNRNLDQLDPSFMYTQILKEILLTIKFDESHIKEYIEHCRKQFIDNDYELKKITKFEREYKKKRPIWWYTYECFLYPMLNYALRVMDVDTIIKMGFFIDDLHCDIEKVHKEQIDGGEFRKSFVVYRGQGLSKADFNRMEKTKGGLLSFNNFLSTSKIRDVALDFIDNAVENPDLISILFVMTIDPSQSTTPFASVNGMGRFGTIEDEILFSMHTVFRIQNIKSLDQNHCLFEVHLILTSDKDKDLLQLTEHIRKESSSNEEGWRRLGDLLLEMGRFDKAHQIYKDLLERATDEKQKATIYYQLGIVKCRLGEYMKSVLYYGQALDIYKKLLHSNHPCLAALYSNIGVVFKNMGEYSKALLTYEKALEIEQKSLPPDHLNLGKSYANIGTLYMQMGEQAKALPYLEKDLEISLKALPSTHPELATTYNNIGLLHDRMKNYSKAYSCYERAVDIAQRALPPNHPHLRSYRHNFENVKKKL